MSPPAFGSLFSGIGGLDLGLERAGWQCRWQVECKPYCRMVLRKHWPGVPKYRDVHQFPPAGRMPSAVDLIAGGFPCQDASVANTNGKGINGSRTGLWTEFARVVGIFRPHLVLLENVPGLLRRGFGRVLGDLAALGYDAEWDCLPAATFGAPHRRDRLWIVAYANRQGERQPGRVWEQERERADDICATFPDADGERCQGPGQSLSQGWDKQDPPGSGQIPADSDRRRRSSRSECPGRQTGSKPDRGRPVRDTDSDVLEEPRVFGPDPRLEQSDWWDAEPDVGRVAHGVPARVHRLEGLGNAVVPVAGEWLGNRLMNLVKGASPS